MSVTQYLWVAGIVFWGEVGAVVGVCKRKRAEPAPQLE